MPETYPQDIDGFDARMEYAGPIEWEDDTGIHYRLTQCVRGYTGQICFMRERKWPSGWKRDDNPTDHEASCVIFFANYKKLAHEGIWLRPVKGGYLVCRWLHDEVHYLYQYGSHWTGMEKSADVQEDSHAAQAAAIDAVMKEKAHEK